MKDKLSEMTMDEKDWSDHDREVYELTGFRPAKREFRHCTSCDGEGHYYHECNNGSFLNMAKGLAIALKKQ